MCCFPNLRFPTTGMLFSLEGGGAMTALAGRGTDFTAGCGRGGAATALAGRVADFAVGCGGGGAGGDRRLGVPELLREAGEEEEE
jgi:hypothetical protein